MFLRRKGIAQIAKNYFKTIGVSNDKRCILQNSSLSTSTAVDSGSIGAQDEQPEVDQLKKLRATFDDEIKDDGIIPIYKKALLYGSKIAVKDTKGEVSFARLFIAAKKLAIKISNICGSGTNSRVCYLCANDRLYIVAQWAAWFSGQIGKCANKLYKVNHRHSELRS